MREIDHQLIVKTIKSRLEAISSDENEMSIVWMIVLETLRPIISTMLMSSIQGLNPDKFIEALRAIVDGIELAFQEAKKSND